MRIGIMLRAYDRPGGIGIYSRNIVRQLVHLDQHNHYVLFYNNRDHIGTYGELEHVDEVCIPPANQILWDQWHVRRAMRQWKIDLVFNTKFSVPLFTKVKRVMVLHGASWYVCPEVYGKLDVMYVKAAMPIYCRACDHLLSNSELTTNDFVNIVGVPPEKITTTHLAADEKFRVIEDPDVLQAVQSKYELPERFILTVTSYDPRKNFETLLKALELCRAETDVHLVVVGKNCERYADDFDITGRGLSDAVHFPGWIDHDDLPAIYNLADVFGFPSIYEEFGIPVVEAMSCGCPIVSSSTGAIPELTQGAALLNEPFDANAMGADLLRILQSPDAAEKYRQKGLARAKAFSWEDAARKTLTVFEQLAGTEPGRT
jgi:glycosyltransferase involved in cell wall biosynthesis